MVRKACHSGFEIILKIISIALKYGQNSKSSIFGPNLGFFEHKTVLLSMFSQAFTDEPHVKRTAMNCRFHLSTWHLRMDAYKVSLGAKCAIFDGFLIKFLSRNEKIVQNGYF